MVNEGELAYWTPKKGGQSTVIVHSIDLDLKLAYVSEPGAHDPDAQFEVELEDLRPE